jgi:hypothetical protein
MLPLNNNHLSTMATILGSQGWSLNTSLTVSTFSKCLKEKLKPQIVETSKLSFFPHLLLYFVSMIFVFQKKEKEQILKILRDNIQTFFEEFWFYFLGNRFFFSRYSLSPLNVITLRPRETDISFNN